MFNFVLFAFVSYLILFVLIIVHLNICSFLNIVLINCRIVYFYPCFFIFVFIFIIIFCLFYFTGLKAHLSLLQAQTQPNSSFFWGPNSHLNCSPTAKSSCKAQRLCADPIPKPRPARGMARPTKSDACRLLPRVAFSPIDSPSLECGPCMIPCTQVQP